MDGMTACGVSMMCRFLVMPTVVMLRCFFVVSGSVGVMLGSLPMMLSAIMGIIEEGQEVMKEFKGEPALDAGLLAAAQAVEHYEIARYGTLKTWAAELGLKEAVKLLDATLAEEKKTDETLTRLAEQEVNQHAQAA
jgi:ferritin-like metal-binding protein YciE